MFISVAADLVFSDLKEPVRIVKESKVKVFPSSEKFWNPAKPRLHEEYTMELKEVIYIFLMVCRHSLQSRPQFKHLWRGNIRHFVLFLSNSKEQGPRKFSGNSEMKSSK